MIIEEFQRATKASTGNFLDPHVVNVVFQIFDIDGQYVHATNCMCNFVVCCAGGHGNRVVHCMCFDLMVYVWLS